MKDLIISYDCQPWSNSVVEVQINSLVGNYFTVLIPLSDLPEFKNQFERLIYGEEYQSMKNQFEGRIYVENDHLI